MTRRGEDNSLLWYVDVRVGDLEVSSSYTAHYSVNLPEERHTLIFEKEGYRTQIIPIEMHAGQSIVLDVVMQPLPTMTLSGQITDGAGLAAAGARVWDAGFPGSQVLSDPEGNYSLTVQDSSTCLVEVYKQGLNEATRSVWVYGPTVEDFTLLQNPQWLPSLPSVHGYRAFDHNDLGGVEAGRSSAVGVVAQQWIGSSGFLTLTVPFTFGFFGEDFDQVTIYRHGFIAPGPAEPNLVNLCNQDPLPSSYPWFQGIFGYHDCFSAGGNGTLHAGYSQARGGFVVEYHNWNLGNDTPATSFQIVILDPTLYSSPTGDASFLFRYHWGANNSCTVGIDQPGGPEALAYLHNSNYAHSSCSPLGPSSTLLITPRLRGMLCDSTEPVVVSMEPLDDTLDWTGPFYVRAKVLHPCGVLGIQLLWRINGGNWHVQTMTPGGTGYEGELPSPLSTGDLVEYKVRATSRGSTPVTGECESDTLELLPCIPLVTYTFDAGNWQGFSQGYCDTWTEWERFYYPSLGWCMGKFGPGYCQLKSPVLDLSHVDQVLLSFFQKVFLEENFTASHTRLWVNDRMIQEFTTSFWQDIDFGSFEFFDISPWAAGQEQVQLVFDFEANNWDHWFLDDITVSAAGSIIPEVRIEYTGRGNLLQLEWQAAGVSTQYHLYSAPSPEGPWSLLAEVNGTGYEVPIQTGSRFFQVRSVLPIPVRQGPIH